MFRRGALPIVVLSVICSALFSWWITAFAQDNIVASIVIFLAYFTSFVLFFGSIYDIAHKVQIKANKYFLGVAISAIIAFTALFKGFEYSNIYLGFVSVVAIVCAMFLANIGRKYEEEE